MSRKWKAVGMVGLKIVGAVALLELTAFLALLYFAKERSPVRSETYLFDAHRNHQLNPQFAGHSPDGFRSDRLIPREKPPKTIRIIALGTSALYGIGASAPYPIRLPLTNDETITAHLETILNRRLETVQAGMRVEIINAGVSAYRTYHHLIHLNAKLLDYHPDIVINIDGQNDFYKDQLDNPWNQYAYSTSVIADQYNRRTLFLPAYTFTRALSGYSFTFNLSERVFRRLWSGKMQQPLQSVSKDVPQLKGDFAERVRGVAERQYIRDLWQIHQLGRFSGYDHYVYLQPQIVFEPDEQLSESDRSNKRITQEHLPNSETEKMQKIRAMLPAIFKARDIPLYDVGEISTKKTGADDLYLDYCHLTPKGAELTAARIADHLYPKVLERIRGPHAVAAKP